MQYHLIPFALFLCCFKTLKCRLLKLFRFVCVVVLYCLFVIVCFYKMAPRRLTKEEKIWINDKFVSLNGHVRGILDQWPFQTPPPRRAAVYELRKKYLDTGSLQNKKTGGRSKSQRTPQNQALVSQLITQNPNTSTRQLSRVTGIHRTTLMKVMKDLKLKPYIPRSVQALLPNDPNSRYPQTICWMNFYPNANDFLQSELRPRLS